MTEIEREQVRLKVQSFFDDLWKNGDPWELETSVFEEHRYTRLLAMLDRVRYERVLEIGCGAGAFTRRIAGLAGQVLALDASSDAIAKACAAQANLTNVEFRAANIMDYDPQKEGPWDLIIMSDTIYYLGWLYPFFDIAWLAMDLFATTRPGGKFLLANCYGGPQDYLMYPSMIHTYRDLFRNVGYSITAEQSFEGMKNGLQTKGLISVFEKSTASGNVAQPSG